jgi:hypothetical protein
MRQSDFFSKDPLGDIKHRRRLTVADHDAAGVAKPDERSSAAKARMQCHVFDESATRRSIFQKGKDRLLPSLALRSPDGSGMPVERPIESKPMSETAPPGSNLRVFRRRGASCNQGLFDHVVGSW